MKMGCSQSYPGLTADVLEEYTTLTYLSKGEILHLMKKFHSINPDKLDADYQHRFPKDEVIEKFDVLKQTFLNIETMDNLKEIINQTGEVPLPYKRLHTKNNPFQDRIFRVFSSKKDDCFSFEDLLDLCSAMSQECPPEVKAAWAFKVYDLDGNNQISASDIVGVIDRLTSISDIHNHIDQESKNKIATTILEEMKLDNSGSIGLNEFQIIMSRIPEFQSSFYFRL